MFTGIITGVNVKNAVIYGQGIIDGNAGPEKGNWWHEPKAMRTACRPRMIFLERCRQMVIQGITVRNSPSWNIHPYFSDHLRFLDLKILNPKDSPNTDGLDPESCEDVEIAADMLEKLAFSLEKPILRLEELYLGDAEDVQELKELSLIHI